MDSCRVGGVSGLVAQSRGNSVIDEEKVQGQPLLEVRIERLSGQLLHLCDLQKRARDSLDRIHGGEIEKGDSGANKAPAPGSALGKLDNLLDGADKVLDMLNHQVRRLESL